MSTNHEGLREALRRIEEHTREGGVDSKWINETARAALAASINPVAVDSTLIGGAGDGLWCLHIEGPDDVYPAPSREDAQKAADLFSAWEARQPKDEYSPVMRAVVAPWPHDAASHAAGVGGFAAEWLQVPQELGITTPPAAAAGREAVIAELIEAATAAQGDGVDRVVACHGYKCRELNCASCFGEDAAVQYVDAARVRAHRLSAAIDAARASTPEANDEPR